MIDGERRARLVVAGRKWETLKSSKSEKLKVGKGIRGARNVARREKK
jgi:hypothetical protein